MLLSDRKFEICFFSHLEVIYGGQDNVFWLESTIFCWWGSVNAIVGQDVFVCESKVALVGSG